MKLINSISTLAHSIEDLFYFLCEEKPHNVDCSDLSDLVLEGADFIKADCSYEELYKFFMQTVFLKDLELTQGWSWTTSVSLHGS